MRLQVRALFTMFSRRSVCTFSEVSQLLLKDVSLTHLLLAENTVS